MYRMSESRVQGLLDSITEKTEREAFLCMELALSYGFWPYQKVEQNRDWPVNAEQSISFQKSSTVIWFAPKTLHGVGPEQSNKYIDPWRAADLIDGSFRNHRSYDTLAEAITTEGGVV